MADIIKHDGSQMTIKIPEVSSKNGPIRFTDVLLAMTVITLFSLFALFVISELFVIF